MASSLRFNAKWHLQFRLLKPPLVHYDLSPLSWWTALVYAIFFHRKPFETIKLICTLTYLVLKQTPLYSVLHYF